MEEENFSAHSIGEETAKKKRVVRKSSPRPIWEKKIEKEKMKKIDKELTSIYEDKGGKMPDMKAIKIRRRHPVLRFIFALVIVGGLMAAAAWAGFFLLPNTKTTGKQIGLTIQGPTELTLGATSTYIISYDNNQNIKLKDAVLTVNYPESFAYLESSVPSSNDGHTEWKLNEIPANGTGEIKITGKSFGAINQNNSWRIFLNYVPENFNSELQNNTTLETTITKSPLSLSASGPDNATIGDNVEYKFTLKNEGEWWPEQLMIEPNWPENFYLVSSSPLIQKDGKWLITIPSSATNTTNSAQRAFTVIGKFTDLNLNIDGAAEMNMSANLLMPYGPSARLYQISSTSLITALAKNGHNFSLAINGTMADLSSRPGDSLNITLYLKNSGKESMKDVSVKLVLDSPSLKKQSALNWADLEDALDGNILGEQLSETIRRGQITWNSGHLPALAEVKPNQEINIDLRLPIKDAKIFDLENLTEYLIKTNAEITFMDKDKKEQILSSNPITITLNSDLTFESRITKSTAAAQDKREVNWVLNNNFHPLKNIELTATLFGDVEFVAPEETPAGEVKYDSDLKQITWAIAEMPESIDVLALPFNIIVKQINPTQNILISKVRVKADDTVTGQTIEFMGEETPVE